MKHKILYVDDEESNLIIFKDTFRRDFEVIIASSAEIALQLLEKSMVEVVITDQRMPGMTGVELLKEINTRYSDLPPHRLIVSGYAENEDIQLAFNEFKLSKFISKPWDYEELKQIIDNSLKD
jgi:response regulator RpfG family c-di-GMP phosphodiesterase